MKKIFKKSNVFSFILGAIIFGGIVGVSAYTILASDIGYTPSDNSWQVNNVKDAIDELYSKSNTINFNELYTLNASGPQDFSYTFSENDKNVLIILFSIRDKTLNESDSTILLPNDALKIYDMATEEGFNGRTGSTHTVAYFIKNPSNTVSGRISYRGSAKIIEIN